jgi:hypothetical protein
MFINETKENELWSRLKRRVQKTFSNYKVPLLSNAEPTRAEPKVHLFNLSPTGIPKALDQSICLYSSPWAR